MKTYPTYDELAEAYDIARSSAHDNVKRLSPILADTLDRLGLLPKRKFETVEEFQECRRQLELDQLLVDVTERPCRRHQDHQVQRERYSGKKTTFAQKPDCFNLAQEDCFLRGDHRWSSSRLHLTQNSVSTATPLV